MKIKLKQNMDDKTIFLSQKVYLEKALEHTDMLDSKLIYCLIISGVDF